MSQGRDSHPHSQSERYKAFPREGLGHGAATVFWLGRRATSWQGGHCTQKRVGLGEAKLRPKGNAGGLHLGLTEEPHFPEICLPRTAVPRAVRGLRGFRMPGFRVSGGSRHGGAGGQ